MAAFQLLPGERLIGRSWMSFCEPWYGRRYRRLSGKIYVTDRRIYFDCVLLPHLTDSWEAPLSAIKGFQRDRHSLLPIPLLRIFCQDGTCRLFSDFRANRLGDWLRQAGVQEYSRAVKKRNPLYSIPRNILCLLFALWVLFGAFPTGWLYDIGAGTGTRQGQRPAAGVHRLAAKEDLRALAEAQTPVAAAGSRFVPCPLLRLRNTRQAGTHAAGDGRQVRVPAYHVQSYPRHAGDVLLQTFLLGGLHVPYYLMEQRPGYYLCVLFDEYLLLQNALGGEVQLPVGFVRRATAQEQEMLEKMAVHCHVDTRYVLDAYRDGKTGGADVWVRLAVAAGGLWLWFALERRWIKK